MENIHNANRISSLIKYEIGKNTPVSRPLLKKKTNLPSSKKNPTSRSGIIFSKLQFSNLDNSQVEFFSDRRMISRFNPHRNPFPGIFRIDDRIGP